MNFSHTSQHVAKADRFDIMEKKWEEITDMQQARGGAFGVASQEKIFVAGGADEEGTVLKTCEVYNVSTNEWQLIANLNVYRTHGSMFVLVEHCMCWVALTKLRKTQNIQLNIMTNRASGL